MDEVAHELDAIGIVQDGKLNSALAKKFLGSHEITVLSDDDARNAIKQRASRAHDARTESAHQRKFGPVPASPSIADAHRLGVSRWVSGLYSQIVTTRDNLSIFVCENGANREAALPQTATRLFQGSSEKFSCVHGWRSTQGTGTYSTLRLL